MRSWAFAGMVQLSCCACACASSSDGGQTGGEDFTCAPGSYTPVERDQVAGTSYSAAQVLDVLGTERRATVRYEDGSSAQLTFELTFVGPARSSSACDVMQLPMLLDASSSDGAWSTQSRSVTLFATSASKVALPLVGDPSSFGLDPKRFGVATHASYDLSVLVSFGKDDASGSVAIVGHDPERKDTTYRLGTVKAP
jgi:hypothetical protein